MATGVLTGLDYQLLELLPLVRSAVSRITDRPDYYSLEEMVNDGLVGAWKAIKCYDPDKSPLRNLVWRLARREVFDVMRVMCRYKRKRYANIKAGRERKRKYLPIDQLSSERFSYHDVALVRLEGDEWVESNLSTLPNRWREAVERVWLGDELQDMVAADWNRHRTRVTGTLVKVRNRLKGMIHGDQLRCVEV